MFCSYIYIIGLATYLCARLDLQSFPTRRSSDLGDPVVVEIEVLPAGERVPRLAALGVDRERRVPAAAALRTGPLRRGDDRGRGGLSVGEGDPLAFVFGGQVGQLGAGALLERVEALRRQASVGRAGQRQDRLACVQLARQRRPSVRWAAADGAVLTAQVVDFAGEVERDTFGG